MRWNELEGALPQTALQQLANTHPSVEAFLVARSKAVATSHGHLQAGGAGPEGPTAGDPSTVAAWEAAIAGCIAPEWRSGTQLMEDLQYHIQVLPTGCFAVDSLLGGGLREGTVVEVAGETASGKTQLCLSAAATTALRGEAVLYVDTTGSFTPERVVQLAEAEAEATSSGAPWPQGGNPDLSSRVLGCISLLRPSSVYDLLALLDRLEATLERHQRGRGVRQMEAPNSQMQPPPGTGTGAGAGAGAGPPEDRREQRQGPRLVIVDSVSALLSPVVGSNQHTQGTTLVTAVGHALKQLAERHSLVVLLTNHVTAAGPLARGAAAGGRSGADGGGGAAAAAAATGVGGLKPALGEQWRPQPHMRVQLSLDDTQSAAAAGARVATLTSSPLQAGGQKATFRILPSGLL